MFDKKISRRKFVKYISKATASLMAFGPFARLAKASITTLDPRVGLPNPFVTTDGRPILVCVNGTDFDAMLTAGLQAIGGLGLLIDSNQDIMLKLNCVIAEGYPTTSDVNSVVSTIGAIREHTNGTVKVGDVGSGDNQYIYDFLNLEPAVTAAGGQLIVMGETYLVRHPSWSIEIPDIEVFADIYNAPILICLGNLKRHSWAHFTCALKNHVGSISGPGVSGSRAYLHSLPHYSIAFLRMVADLASLINPELNIVDARSIWAINGPTSHEGGEIRQMNKVIICGDMLATDVYCSQLMDEYDETYDPSILQPTIDRAFELGLGEPDLNNVEIIELNINSANDNAPAKPDRISLKQNYPNPFNARTFIEFDLPNESHVAIRVYDSLGRQVAKLADNIYNPGYHKTAWNASGHASGTYLYEIMADGYRETKKMLLIK
jgi:uncharacterized protein (DUF362 family)